MADDLAERIAVAFRMAAVEGRLPASREPLPFLTLAKIAASVVTTPRNADGCPCGTEYERRLHGTVPDCPVHDRRPPESADGGDHG